MNRFDIDRTAPLFFLWQDNGDDAARAIFWTLTEPDFPPLLSPDRSKAPQLWILLLAAQNHKFKHQIQTEKNAKQGNTRFKQKRMPNKGTPDSNRKEAKQGKYAQQIIQHCAGEGNFELPDRKGQNCSLHLQNADLFLFWLFLWLWRICEKKLTLHMERWISPERGGRILSQEALSVSICVYSALLAGGQKYSKYTKTFHLLFVLNAIGSWAPNPVSVLIGLQHFKFSPCGCFRWY